MEVTALCFRLLMLQIIQQFQESDAAFLRITPNRLQHFQHDSVSLECVGFDDSTQLRVIRNTQELTPVWVATSFFTVHKAYPTDSGEYWCETNRGERSNSVNITVTAGPVILESPVLPVKEGDAVPLRCRNRKMFSNLTARFYKDGVLIANSFTGDVTIHSVLKSDEGLYKCKISDTEESPESWLTVREPAVPDAPCGAPLVCVCRLISLVVVGTPYLLSTIILGLIYRDKRRAHQLVAEDRRHDVVMEME